MKKKFLGVIMALSIVSLVGCGEQATTMGSNIESKDESVESSEPTIEPSDESIEDGLVEEGTLGDVPSGEKFELGDYYEEEGTLYDYTKEWARADKNTKCEAWMKSFLSKDDPSKAWNITYFKNGDGDEMTFAWIGISTIGNIFGVSPDESTFNLADDTHRLMMWHGGKLSNDSDYMKNTNVETIMGWSAETPIADTYQVVEDSESAYCVIFKVKTTIDGVNYIGYANFVDYYDINECYQFEYLTMESTYNNDETLAMVNSIKRVDLDD